MREKPAFEVMRSTETGERLCGREEETRIAQNRSWSATNRFHVRCNSGDRLRGHCVGGLELRMTGEIAISFRFHAVSPSPVHKTK